MSDPTSWLSALSRVREELRERIEPIGRLLQAPSRRDPLQIHAYRTYGTSRRVLVAGRVLENEGIAASSVGDSHWRNLIGVLKRLESDEVPDALVRVSIAGAQWELRANREGHFSAWLDLPSELPSDAIWHDAAFELLHPPSARGEVVRATGQVLVPAPGARFAVISDVDDTIVRTNATDVVRMAQSIFFANAHTRLPFPGVAAFYRALESGERGIAANPIFYVSSSPWNFYDLLVEFLRLQRIPAGPLVLRDWGISPADLPTSHGAHKLTAIRTILECYPTLPFILVGDSGQEDPEIYARVVHDHPSRILAAYIRNVTPNPARSQAIRLLADEVLKAGSTLVLADDTLAAAKHAAEHGWIDANALPEIVADKREDERSPAPGDDPAAPSEPPTAPTVVVDGEQSSTISKSE